MVADITRAINRTELESTQEPERLIYHTAKDALANLMPTIQDKPWKTIYIRLFTFYEEDKQQLTNH